MINDDFCDCPFDGADEPMTSACANGKFTCIQDGKVIPSGWVRDGVKDCSDGTDELDL